MVHPCISKCHLLVIRSALLRRVYHQHHRPRDVLGETAEQIVAKDTLLYRYENPKRMAIQLILSGGLLGTYAWMSYFSWSLNSRLKDYKTQVEKRTEGKLWLSIVEKASPGVGIGFGLLGGGISFYWLLRTLFTVRRLILRKGGKYITIVTYGILLGFNSKTTTIPLARVRIYKQ